MASPETRFRNGRHGDGRGARFVEGRRAAKSRCGGFDEVAAMAEIEHGCGISAARQAGRRQTAAPPRPARCARVEPDARPRRVVRGEHARRERRCSPPVSSGATCERTPSSALDGLSRHAAGTQQQRFAAEAGHDGRFDARPGSPPRRARRRSGRRDRPAHGRGVVGLTRPERLAEGAATGPARLPPATHARRDGRARATPRCRGPRWRGRQTCSPALVGTTSVSGPGQNARASALRGGVEAALRQRRLDIVAVGDEGIEARALLGGIDARHRPAHPWHPPRARRPSRSGRRRARLAQQDPPLGDALGIGREALRRCGVDAGSFMSKLTWYQLSPHRACLSTRV